MKVQGTYTLHAPIDKVWAFLMDPEAIARVLPGCEELKETEPDTFEGVMQIGVASIKGTYAGTVKMRDKTPPTHYRLLIDGSGKRGFVKGEAMVGLQAQADDTVLTYDADAQVGGLIANVGQRVIGGAAKLIINQSLKKLQDELSHA